ncbi:MAG: glycerophosphodiester phosphodiesterase [Pyrinomonadaceae bacterium]
MLRKILKWFGYFWLGIFVIAVSFYFYLYFSTGKPAEAKAIFKQQNSNFLVFAHRGGGGLYPENTLEAFEDSAKLGVDVLELDIHATSDGKLVVLHDSAVDRTTNGRGRVSEMTLENLKKLDAGFQFSPDGGKTFPYRGRGITVPTLEEIFNAFPKIRFNIEPKQQTPSITQPLCSILRERKMTDRVIVGSFRQEVIDKFRAECPEVATSASPKEAVQFLAMYKTGLSDAYAPPMQALQIPENLGYLNVVSKHFVETAHRLNLKVHVWTINDPTDMQRLIEAGVDGIMTDYPDRLLNLLNRPKAVETQK